MDEIWDQVRQAFAFYDKKLSPVCGPARRKLIEKRLEQGYTVECLVAAVHGYVHFHEGLEAQEGFNPRKWFNPETVWREEKMDMRVELGDHPWVYEDPKLRREREVKARQAAARARVEAARKLRPVK
jgi:hypothetical protein